MKSNTRPMDLKMAKTKRKHHKRLSRPEKALHIVRMMEQNVAYHRAIHGRDGWGFTMGQVAAMTCYKPSTALMNDLFQMCDDGMLRVDTRASKRTGLSPVEHIFYLPSQWLAKAHKARRLI